MVASDRIFGIKKAALKRIGALGDEVENDGWRAHWLDLSKFLLNRRGRYLKARNYEPQKGGKMNDEINNGTPEDAVHTASAGMMGGFTSPSIPWMQLTTEDEDLAEFKPVKEYLWRQQQRMFKGWAKANWYTMLPTLYEELGVFGTGATRMDIHPTRGIHLTQHTIGSYYLANGPDGFVDTVVYRYPRTVRQLQRLYKPQDLSKTVRDLIRNEELDRYIRCVNIVEINDGRESNFKDWRGKPFRSVTMEEETNDDEGVLKMGGFDLFPTLTPRTSRRAEDTYGSSRGMRALPDARQLQLNELRGGEALLKTLRPPLNIPSAKYRATVAAGEVNVYKGQRSDAIRPTFTTNFPYGENEDKITKIENRIKNTMGATAFTQFQLLDESGNHQMTIPEIMERRGERLTLLGPTHHSIHNELLIPAVELHWYYMGRNGQIEPPPPDLRGIALEVKFTGQLALAERSSVIRDIELLGDRIALMNQSFPGAADNFNSDVAVQHLARGYLAPPDVINDPEVVTQMRRQRAQDFQNQQRLEQENLESETAKNLAGTPLGTGAAIDQTRLGAAA